MNTVFPGITKHLPSSVDTVLLHFNIAYPPSTALPRLPLSAITHLEITGALCEFNLADTITFIASFPALTALKIGLKGGGWRNTQLSAGIRSLRAPEALRCLDFRSPEMGPFLGWMQGSRVPISTLRLYLEPTTKVPIKPALEYIGSLGPSLTSLALSAPIWNSALGMLLHSSTFCRI